MPVNILPNQKAVSTLSSKEGAKRETLVVITDLIVHRVKTILGSIHHKTNLVINELEGIQERN